MANYKFLPVLAATVTCLLAYEWGSDMGPNNFCAKINCCRNREDSCATPILGTLCYCDDFCNRTRVHDDCCPDYRQVCLDEPPPPPEEIVEPCRHDGQYYLQNQERKADCNTCVCKQSAENEKKLEWSCTQEECIISDDVIRGVNQARGGSWRAADYPQFREKTLKDGLVYKLGTMEITARVIPIRYHKDVFPRSFDAREHWPRFISPIRDQGWCGSDWAIAIAGVTSDRFAIQSKGAEKLLMSPQRLLSCNRKRQKGCDGGHIDVAWNFVIKEGLVDEDCFPYKAAVTKCPFKPFGTLRQDGCRVELPQRKARYSVGPLGKLDNEHDIMYDIMESGPVHAIMTVHQDFFHYRDGVYRYSATGDNQRYGLHSVRIIGWGEDRGDNYWLVANSWGTEWGENGYFRIARGENESGIESFVVSTLAEVKMSNQRK